MASRKPKQSQQRQQRGRQPQRRDESRPRNADYRKVGPTSIEGVEASDLPDKGRGDVFTDYGKEASRQTPDITGGTTGGPTGLHGDSDVRYADRRGGRKKN